MGVLRGALQGGIFFRRNGFFERFADLLPVGTEFSFARAAETILRQFGCAEPNEAHELRLLIAGRCAA